MSESADTRHSSPPYPAAVLAGAAALLASCAVGPDFKAPEAPHNARFVAAGQLPLETAATALPGAGQRSEKFPLRSASDGTC